jgi:hypothetical protein
LPDGARKFRTATRLIFSLSKLSYVPQSGTQDFPRGSEGSWLYAAVNLLVFFPQTCSPLLERCAGVPEEGNGGGVEHQMKHHLESRLQKDLKNEP